MTLVNEHSGAAARMEHSRTFVPPLLRLALEKLEAGYRAFKNDAHAQEEFRLLLNTFAGRPTQLTEAKNLSEMWTGGKCKIFLKREDLTHGGAHKLNNALGQCYLAKYMGFKKIIAETGAGQHGVATAMAAAKLGLVAKVFQGKKDVERQKLNALRMRLFGADLVPVAEGSATLKEAVNAAMREWVATSHDTAYCLGSVVGPSPYPEIVRDFQRVIGEEARTQLLAITQGQMPDAVFACVGGGSNAAGIFSGFVDFPAVELVGCEAAGAASLSHGTMGILHGMETLLLQTEDRQIAHTHSISAGLDYPGVGPWLAGLKLEGRLTSLAITDDQCVSALVELAKTEGILCALESAHALAGAKQTLQSLHTLQPPESSPSSQPSQSSTSAQSAQFKSIVINISGRGDKDLDILLQKGLGGA